jgi:predicted nucleotidyltransferase
MQLIDFFKRVVQALEDKNLRFALAGGMIASIYRQNERTTNDLDFLILTEGETEDSAQTILKEFNLVPHSIRKADLEGGPMFAIKRKNTPVLIIAGRPKEGDNRIGLDFILPSMPWFESALIRAEHNRIDFGFAKVPSLSIEDVIISKFYSLRNDSRRFNDLDDLKSIFGAHYNLDLAYLCGQMQLLKIRVPEAIEDFAPKVLVMTSKKIMREIRRRLKV